jgi:hypothetical protein
MEAASFAEQSQGPLGSHGQRQLASYLRFDGEDAILVDYQDYY